MNLHNVEFVRSAPPWGTAPGRAAPDRLCGPVQRGQVLGHQPAAATKELRPVGRSAGKTTHINYFLIDQVLYLVDLPGYGYAKVPKAEKDRWAKLIESYFADAGLITLGVLIVDARHKPTENDVTMARYFQQTGRPYLVVANKLDKLKKSQIEPSLALIRETPGAGRGRPADSLLRREGEGRDALLARIEATL